MADVDKTHECLLSLPRMDISACKDQVQDVRLAFVTSRARSRSLSLQIPIPPLPQFLLSLKLLITQTPIPVLVNTMSQTEQIVIHLGQLLQAILSPEDAPRRAAENELEGMLVQGPGETLFGLALIGQGGGGYSYEVSNVPPARSVLIILNTPSEKAMLSLGGTQARAISSC